MALLLLGIAGLPTARVVAGSSAADRGRELFNTRGCAHCHGTDGIGGGRGPDLQLVRKRLKAPAMELQIHDGGQGMPAFGDELKAAEIGDLVTYLRARRRSIVPAPAAPKPTPAAKPDPD